MDLRNILDRARRMESHIARSLSDAAKQVAGRTGPREPIELTHAIVETVEREIQPGGRGTLVFPFNTIQITIAAPSDHARARLETIVSGDPAVGDRITERLRAAGCTVDDLEVHVAYVPRSQKHWLDPQFSVAFARVARAAATPPIEDMGVVPRLEVTVLHGTAERRTYGFATDRIEMGRGREVRDSRSRLIRTNDVAFTDDPDQVGRTISREHSHLTYDRSSGQFRVFDDGSVHGTQVVRRGKTVPVPFGARGVRLQSGDEIVLGEARVRVRFEVRSTGA